MLTPQKACPTPASLYIVPARTLSGSTREMLAALDEAVQALLALRLVILADNSAAQSSSPAKR